MSAGAVECFNTSRVSDTLSASHCRRGRGLEDDDGRSNEQVPAGSALYARPRSKVARETRSSLHTNRG